MYYVSAQDAYECMINVHSSSSSSSSSHLYRFPLSLLAPTEHNTRLRSVSFPGYRVNEETGRDRKKEGRQTVAAWNVEQMRGGIYVTARSRQSTG